MGVRKIFIEIGAINISKGKFDRPRSREVAEVEEAFRQVTEAANGGAGEKTDPDTQSRTAPGKKKNKAIPIIAGVAALVLVAVLGIGFWFFMDATKDDGLIYNNVYAAGLNLGGLTPEQAKEAITDVTGDTYTRKDLVIELPDVTLRLRPADTGAQLDVDALVDAAYAYGREGSRWQRAQARANASLTSYTLELLDYMTLDQDYIRQQLQAQADAVESKLAQYQVKVEGEVPNLDRTLSEAEADKTVVHKTMTITKGAPERSLNVEDLMEQILTAYRTNDFSVITYKYNLAEPVPLDWEKLEKEQIVKAVDAELNKETFAVTPEKIGYGFDLEEAKKLVEEAEDGAEIVIEFGFIDAEVTMKSLEEYLFKDTLAAYSSPHVWNPNRTTNLELACKAINGTVIWPGEVFSFNKVVGERTAAKGYKPATIYAGTESVDSEGGGVCQVASTIYYCALMADLEIVEREEHQFLVDYVPMGMDATIYWGSYDFKFRNNTDYPIKIYSSTHDGKCHIVLYGTDDRDTYVKMSYEVVSGPHYETEEYKEFTKDNNPKGYKDGEVIQTAYAGYTVKTYRHRYQKGTDKLLSTELEATSVFSSRPRIIAKLKVEETQPTEPPTTEPPTTTQPPTTTEPPTTQPPTTEPPTTEPPTTEPPTDPPTDPPTEPSDPTGEGS